ncbi:MAG: response regulator [Acidobacteriota bacterium]
MRKKVLLVDDSETMRTLGRDALSPHYDVLLAEDGRSSLEVAQRERPDLILMDLLMPGLNGLEACRLLKRLPETKHIPVVMITTAAAKVHFREALIAGCHDYVEKPVDAIELVARVRALVG